MNILIGSFKRVNEKSKIYGGRRIRETCLTGYLNYGKVTVLYRIQYCYRNKSYIYRRPEINSGMNICISITLKIYYHYNILLYDILMS